MGRETLAKDVANGRQPVVGLVGGDVVDVRSARQVRGLIGNVTGHRCWVLSAGKAVAKRRGLDDSLVGELLVGGRNDGQAWRRPVSSRHTRCLGSEPTHRVLVRAVPLGRLLVESSLDDVSLLLSNRHTSLQLLLHDGVLCDKAWGEAGDTDLLDAQAVAGSQRPCGGRLVRFGGVLGEIESPRSGS